MTPIEKKILRHIVKASDEYKLIEDGDKIMVCMSGGKDSFAMLHMLQIIQKRAPFSIELLAVNVKHCILTHKPKVTLSGVSSFNTICSQCQ